MVDGTHRFNYSPVLYALPITMVDGTLRFSELVVTSNNCIYKFVYCMLCVVLPCFHSHYMRYPPQWFMEAGGPLKLLIYAIIAYIIRKNNEIFVIKIY